MENAWTKAPYRYAVLPELRPYTNKAIKHLRNEIEGDPDPLYNYFHASFNGYHIEIYDNDYENIIEKILIKARALRNEAKKANIERIAREDRQAGKLLDPYNFEAFKKLMLNDGYEVTEKDFNYYFEVG